MEVLISTFVIAIGLLGLAALIPVGRFTLVEAGMADRSGACGRAALRDIRVRQMLDPYQPTDPTTAQWVDSTGADAVTAAFTAGSFAIDPMGVATGITVNVGGATSPILRVTLLSPATGAALTTAQAQEIFVWHDDLVFHMPDDRTLRPTQLATGLEHEGNYSWFLTVTPAANESGMAAAERRIFSVSVVVCYKRDLGLDAVTGNPTGECTPDVLQFVGSGYGGGTVQLDAVVEVREGEWIALVGGGCCKWYRVVSAGELFIDTTTGDPDPTSTDPDDLATRLNLDGPDWTVDTDGDGNLDAEAVIIDGVIGVYTTTIEID